MFASRPRNEPLSEVWCPDSGSTTCAIVAPILESMIWPAASSAHSTVPKKKPMMRPTNASLAKICSHSTTARSPTLSGGCSASDTSPSARRIEFLTIAGIVSVENSGIIRKAVAMRTVAMPSSST